MKTLTLSELLDNKDRAINTQKVLLECISRYDKEIEEKSLEIINAHQVPKGFDNYTLIAKIISIIEILDRDLSVCDLAFYVSVLNKQNVSYQSVNAVLARHSSKWSGEGKIISIKLGARVYYRINKKRCL